MKKIIAFFAGLAALAGLFYGSGVGGCGGAAGISSPPVNIPAPVAGLISVTSPDDAGFVRMTGASSSVSSDTRVDVTFESASALTLKDQSAPGDLLGSVVSQADGSFVLDFEAEVGNVIRVQQEGESTVDGPAPVFFEIRAGRILVPITPVGAAISPSFSVAQTLQPSGGNTVLDLYSPSTLAPASGTDAVVAGIQATDFALEDSSQDSYLISTSENHVEVVDFSGSLQGGILSLASPASVATAFGLTYAAVGQNSSTSITLVDNSSVPALDASIALVHPSDGSALPVATPAIAMDQDTGGNDKIAAVAGFDNGDSIFAFLDVAPPPGGGIAVNTSFSLGAGTYDSILLFNSATEALISDSGDDRVLHLSGLGFATTAVIPVGDDPRGIAIYGARAFVCNRADHTVSIVDLTTNAVIGTMTTNLGVGLNPTDIATNPSVPDTAFIANQGDNTVTLFDISDVFAELGI